MGLDMYLNARKYISPTDYEATRAKDWKEIVPNPEFVEIQKHFPAEALKYGESGGEVSINVMYWRKANQIHGWFVDHVQDGVDECKEHDVSHDDLRALLEICKRVKANPAEAEKILPPTGGFFFGTYEIDDYYMEQIDYTMKALEALLAALPESDYEFSYRASW